MVLKAQFVFLFTPSRGFSFSLCLLYEHISIPTWAKERANPCDSVQLSIRPNQMVNIVGLSVVGSGQCSRGEVGGGSANSSDLRRSGKQIQRAPWKFFSGSGPAAGRNVMDSLKLQRKCCP